MENRKEYRRSVLMGISAMLIFGTIGIFRRYIPLSSAFLAFVRGIMGGAFLLLAIKLRKGPPAEKIPRRDFLLLVISGTCIGINWILLFEAYRYTTIAVATLCYYMQPTIVMLMSPLILRERITRKKGICAAVAVAGMVLVSGVTGAGAQRADIRGVLLGLGAAVFYASDILINKVVSGVEIFRKTAVQLFSAGIVLIPYLLLTGEFRGQSMTPLSAVLVLVMGIVHTGIAYVFYFGCMEHLRAQSVAILSYIDPVSALIFSALFLEEPLSLTGIIGAVMIIGSALVSELRAE